MRRPKRNGGSRPWRRIRDQVLERDGWICWICGRPGADSADHVIPYSLGGSDDPSNLRAAHHRVWPHCNRSRGARPIEAIREEIGSHDTNGGWTW